MMMTGLMKNNLTQKLATGAAALGVLAGVGLASSPAQAGIFSLQTFNGTTPANCTATPAGVPTNGCVTDSEWGFPGDEPIWSTLFDKTVPGTGFDANPPETCVHGGSNCANGWDNPLVTKTPNSFVEITYFGSGTAALTNDFRWNDVSVFGAHNDSNDGCANPNNFGTPCNGSIANPTFTNPQIRQVPGNGILPFQFIADVGGANFTINNGDFYNGASRHYFATTTGTWADPTGNAVYLGLSDRLGATGDDDAADFVVRIRNVTVPEPGTVLGLLAVGGLGALMKRKKQG